jgi:hypothetical protein
MTKVLESKWTRRRARWTRPRYFAGYLYVAPGDQANGTYIFRANYIPDADDGLPFNFCFGDYILKRDAVDAAMRQGNYRGDWQ